MGRIVFGLYKSLEFMKAVKYLNKIVDKYKINV